MMIPRILVTDRAQKVIETLQAEHGSLIFHQSGGCCDGSAPMCFPEGELLINENDVCLGTILNCPYYMAKDQFEYWQQTQVTLDVVEGRGASFSLEAPKGMRFIIQSRLFRQEEIADLVPIRVGA